MFVSFWSVKGGARGAPYVMELKGPGVTFALLLDEADGVYGERAGASLPAEWQQVYGGDWRLPEAAGRPHVYVNFAVARDGRVSFNLPERMGGGEISGFNAHDRWLMGLLRARADAILMGDTTLGLEPSHLWTAAYICPDDAEAFADLRLREGRTAPPLQVFLSLTGNLDVTTAVFAQPELTVIVATTHEGSSRVRQLVDTHQPAARVEIWALGDTEADLNALVDKLYLEKNVRSLLCEGGPRVYGGMLARGLIDDEFVTLCPQIVGNDAAQGSRPGLVEGVAFTPENAPQATLVSLRRVGDHLFLRSRYRHGDVRPSAAPPRGGAPST